MGGIKQETRDYRTGRLKVWFRCLDAVYGGDDAAKRAHAERECGIPEWSYWAYRNQVKGVGEGHVPLPDRMEWIEADIEALVKKHNLTPNGYRRKASEPTEVRRAALREGSPISHVEMVRTLTSGMEKADLKVVFDHVFGLMSK